MVVSLNKKRRGARANSSGHVGVSFDRRTSRWQASVTLSSGVRKFIGRAPTPEGAAALRAAFISEHGVAAAQSKAATVTAGEVSA